MASSTEMSSSCPIHSSLCFTWIVQITSIFTEWQSFFQTDINEDVAMQERSDEIYFIESYLKFVKINQLSLICVVSKTSEMMKNRRRNSSIDSKLSIAVSLYMVFWVFVCVLIWFASLIQIARFFSCLRVIVGTIFFFPDFDTILLFFFFSLLSTQRDSTDHFGLPREHSISKSSYYCTWLWRQNEFTLGTLTSYEREWASRK